MPDLVFSCFGFNGRQILLTFKLVLSAHEGIAISVAGAPSNEMNLDVELGCLVR